MQKEKKERPSIVKLITYLLFVGFVVLGGVKLKELTVVGLDAFAKNRTAERNLLQPQVIEKTEFIYSDEIKKNLEDIKAEITSLK